MMKNQKIYVLKDFYGEDVNLIPVARKYRVNSRLAIELVDADSEETFTYLTTNINFEQSKENGEDLAFVDTNNNSWAEEFIKKNKLGVKTGYYGMSGRCVYPEYRFDLTKLNSEESYDGSNR